MPLRFRLGLSFAAATLVLVAVGGLLFARSFRSGLETSLQPGLRGQADTLGRELQTDPGSFDLVDALGSADVVAQVLDADGTVLTTTDEAGAARVVPLSVVRATTDGRVFANVIVRDKKEREPFRAIADPVSTSAGRRIVVVATSLEPTDAAVTRVDRALWIGGAIAVAVAGIGGWLLASAALRPVERMRREAADISEHDPTARLPVPATRDEIAALATTMNALLARLQNALQRQRAFVADASHELRTPLATLQAELELARRPQRSRADLDDAIEHAAGETQRLARLAEEMLLLARADEPTGEEQHSAPVAAIVEDAIADTNGYAEGRDVRIRLDAAEGVRARVAPTLLRQAVRNLLNNVTVRLRRDGESAVIEVVDEGPGFPPEFLPHAFERFRRADDSRSRAGGGTGLGLAIVLAAARAHGGTAAVANRSDGGAIVTLRIPAEM